MADQRQPVHTDSSPAGDAGAAQASLRDLIEWERKRIRERRRVVGLPHSEQGAPGSELAGLALSGGGIRSACFNMGLLQALHRFGIFRCFDYLSTVSGGGYIGIHLSSWIRRHRRPVTTGSFPLEEDDGQCQNAAVKQLIYGGDYIVKPLAALNKYLIGVVLNNLALFSLLVAVATMIAMVYRSLDYPVVRDHLDLIGFDNDLTTPFLISVVIFLFWVAAWVFSYFQRQAEAPGQVARCLLRFLIASVLAGCAMLVGNGDIPLPWASAAGDPFSVPDYIWIPMVFGVLMMLLPVLQPKRLIASAERPRRPYERWVFRGTCTALLVGVPMILVGFIGRENISGYSTFPDRGLQEADIRDWPKLCSLFQSGRDEAAIFIVSPSTPPAAAHNTAVQRLQTLAVKVVDAAKDEREKRHELDLRQPDEDHFRPDHYTDARWRRVELDDELARFVSVTSWLAGLNSEGEAAAYRDAFRKSLNLRRRFIADFNASLLLYRVLTDVLVARAEARLPQEKDAAHAMQLAAARDHAMVASRTADTAYDVGRANRRLMELLWREMLRTPHDIQRRIVISEDQWYRAEVLLMALVMFVVFGFIDINATSMHRYYRTRLTEAFLVPPESNRAELNLEDLDTTEFGGPYHLIGTTVSLLGRHEGASDDVLTIRPTHSDLERDPRTEDTFLLSPGFVGSVATHFERTHDYQGRIRGAGCGLTADEALALSGAAVSPSQNDNLLIAFLMFSLNLRLGQWLPNPRRRCPWMRPRLIYLLLSLLRSEERRPYVFVSDGGHNENLGIVELLKRRCRLIVVSDAGCDPQHRFDDLARAVRTSRVFGGIRIEPLINGRGKEFSAKPLALKESANAEPAAADPAVGDPRHLPRTNRHFVVGRILYPAREGRDGPAVGLLVYLKPSLTGDESLDVLQYQRENSHFPHQPTSDQVFDSAQVESYRQLGFHIGQELCRMIRSGPHPPQDSDDDEFNFAAGIEDVQSDFRDDGPIRYRSVTELTEQIAAGYRARYRRRRETPPPRRVAPK